MIVYCDVEACINNSGGQCQTASARFEAGQCKSMVILTGEQVKKVMAKYGSVAPGYACSMCGVGLAGLGEMRIGRATGRFYCSHCKPGWEKTLGIKTEAKS